MYPPKDGGRRPVVEWATDAARSEDYRKLLRQKGEFNGYSKSWAAVAVLTRAWKLFLSFCSLGGMWAMQ